MAITPNRNKDKLPHSGNRNDRDSFEEHDEYMSKFRAAHPRVETKEPANAGDTGWLVLIPIPEIRLGPNRQN